MNNLPNEVTENILDKCDKNGYHALINTNKNINTIAYQSPSFLGKKLNQYINVEQLFRYEIIGET